MKFYQLLMISMLLLIVQLANAQNVSQKEEAAKTQKTYTKDFHESTMKTLSSKESEAIRENELKNRKEKETGQEKSPGTTDPITSYMEVSGEGWSVIKARSNSYSDDSTYLKLTNMTDGGTGTEMILECKNEEGLSFNSFSDLSGNTTDNILVLEPNGEVGIGTDNPRSELHLIGDMTTNWGLELNHYESTWGGNATQTWLKKGWTSATGDMVYIGGTGNRAVSEQHAMILGQNGVLIGNGHANADQLSQLGVTIQAQEFAGNGGTLKMHNFAGDVTIELDAEYGTGGKGRITTEELEIIGGADFAEYFHVENQSEIQKGMVVSIDANNAGKLKLTEGKYDTKVAGVISGANDVDTGLLMGDRGTIADGDYPIALSGRVYVMTTSEGGSIQPGDFLTTSSTQGHAMKAKNWKKSQGAIIGKAMTEADEDGFVLVLINLQ